MNLKKNKKIFFIPRNLCLISLILFGHKFFAQTYSSDNIPNKKLEEEFRYMVNTLADTSMGGRYAGSDYELKALCFFKEKLIEYSQNYHIKTDTFSYCCRNDSIVTSHNFWLYPKKRTKKIVIFTAHYDHLPPNSKYSKEIWNKHKIHPGADDNASGVAMAVMLFKYLNAIENKNFQTALILFSGHEEGLNGSKHWLDNTYNNNDSILLLINFDMVGRLSDETKIISIRINDDNAYKERLQHIKSDLHPMLTPDGLKDTDAGVFFNRNISSFTVSTGIHSDYHRISDTPDKINFSGMIKVYNYMISFLTLL